MGKSCNHDGFSNAWAFCRMLAESVCHFNGFRFDFQLEVKFSHVRSHCIKEGLI